MKKHIPIVLSLFVAFVFLQSLFFKFAGLFGEPADITVYIFRTVGTWMSSIGLGSMGELFAMHGELAIGVVELVASVLILLTVTRFYGALLGLAVMSGAIFFHIFTPLGLFPYTDLECLTAECPKEYALFFMAIGVWVSCAYLALTHMPGKNIAR